MSSSPGPCPASDPYKDLEAGLMRDPRFQEAVALFNRGDWYACHDGFEDLWHQTLGPLRSVLQGILQIAVAHLHLERGNLRGATMLMGEGLGRLRDCGDAPLGLDLKGLRAGCRLRLEALQRGEAANDLPLPRLDVIAPGA